MYADFLDWVLQNRCYRQKQQWKCAEANTSRVGLALLTSTQRSHGHVGCVGRGGGFVGAGLARELIDADETWLAREYTASLITVIDRLRGHANAFALAQSHLGFSQLCNDLFWLGSFSNHPAPSLRSQP